VLSYHYIYVYKISVKHILFTSGHIPSKTRPQHVRDMLHHIRVLYGAAGTVGEASRELVGDKISHVPDLSPHALNIHNAWVYPYTVY